MCVGTPLGSLCAFITWKWKMLPSPLTGTCVEDSQPVRMRDSTVCTLCVCVSARVRQEVRLL